MNATTPNNPANKDNLQNLKKSTQNLRDDIRDDVSAIVVDARDEFTDAANKATRKVRDFINTSSDNLAIAKDSVKEQVRAKPIQSGLIALGAGFILGLLARR